ncbi:hypothetical protein SERLADRAFT_451067 [Serpula lacrymans var. lacrymans S7.9]|uniref:Uncharacterized protein n=1 Tax=Serpula lacrymans var. lacrymans (strain S7.9) TaxID=578457 RepID=F8P3T4_SERL9|nr:uncharacterized protein SERLADRAFT_451067 [Serpula lacrymans var. lacrymans S7.9]EGO22183.1 hypothetical protein SERLADRAFT_451067 [Serpula lacrymans var. lacrymans S7.9]
MDRPVTSKPRGICRYYNTPRGCFAGDHCKFLHGPNQQFTPYDESKTCRYFIQGHCRRGNQCWFRHEAKSDVAKGGPSEEACNICLEKPTSYGLLADCSHVFCHQCIIQWRDPEGKSSDMKISGVTKKCPLCRVTSRFITPSSYFYPQNDPRKQEVINNYKESMARVTCKYFAQTYACGKPCCPFGYDCFYEHKNSDGTPFVFRHGVRHYMKAFKRQQNPFAFFHAHENSYPANYSG